MTDNGISLEDKLNDTADDISLEAILAEYGDFGLGVPPSDEVGARSRRIVMEALGETFTGAATSAEAGTEAWPPRRRRGRAKYRPSQIGSPPPAAASASTGARIPPRRERGRYRPPPRCARRGHDVRSTAPAWAARCRRATRTSGLQPRRRHEAERRSANWRSQARRRRRLHRAPGRPAAPFTALSGCSSRTARRPTSRSRSRNTARNRST
ncbi:MAG: hypothetical protein ACLUEK_10940 [Oscillospiraceae bacterium]